MRDAADRRLQAAYCHVQHFGTVDYNQVHMSSTADTCAVCQISPLFCCSKLGVAVGAAWCLLDACLCLWCFRFCWWFHSRVHAMCGPMTLATGSLHTQLGGLKVQTDPEPRRRKT